MSDRSQISPQLAAERQSLGQWLPHFFRQELLPYPGRWSQVSRMVIAATLSMIVIVTFRIPYGAIGVNCAFILSRENLFSTVRSGCYFILAFAAWALLTPLGARMFASIPLTHFLWEGFTIFLCFFLLRTLANFVLAAGVVVVATATLVIWYLPGPAELNIELTLWQILATAIGALITLLVEVVFRYYSPTDEVVSGIDARLQAIEDLLNTRDGMIGTSSSVAQSITQYAVVGAGALRQQIARGHYSTLERTRLSAFVALLGRSLDLCAAIVAAHSEPGSIQPRRAEDLRRRISFLRQAVKAGTDTPRGHSPEPTIDGAPLFFELEVTVGLMESVLDASADMDPRLTLLEDPGATQRLFARDAFTNRDHVKFALAGTAAAMLCYVLYTALDWPGISTAVTTCLLTALSNIGSSRQKQMLRIGGAMIGGFVFGLGSQILILPYIDSIAGFSVLVAVVTGISAYVATSSPRLSYAGLQMAFAFYLINNTGFSISLDLTTSRDRVIGVLVGIAAMWLVFERIHPRPAASEMVRTFAQSARLIASLRPEASGETEILRIRSIRNQVSQLFTSVNAEADAVLFESGEDRISHLAARDRIRRWLSTLRTIYLLELPLLQFRVSVDRHQISPAYGDIEARLFGDLSQSLNSIADSLESELGYAPRVHEDRPNIEHLSPGISSHDNPPGPAEEEVLRNLMTLLPRLAAQLEAEVQTKLVFAP